MKYVLDSNVALKWVLAEQDTDKAKRLRDEAQTSFHQLIAPDVFSVEVGHALTRAERQGRISVADGWAWWQLIMADAPALNTYLPLMPRAYAISSATRSGIYDCLYVALAEAEGCELITADDKLVNNLQSYFPSIIPLASLP